MLSLPPVPRALLVLRTHTKEPKSAQYCGGLTVTAEPYVSPSSRTDTIGKQKPMMRMRSEDPVMDAMMQEAEARCPRDCWQEEIQLQTSFTIMSDENFEKAWALWSHLPRNRTKLDAVFMELFFESMTAEVI